MTSKVQTQDPPISSSTNHSRRHSSGQGHRSKANSTESESQRTKREQQSPVLTNGHVSRGDRRGSSDVLGKSLSSNNKENAQGHNSVKEDSPEKKKKKKRRKKKGCGGGGGGNAGIGNSIESEGATAGNGTEGEAAKSPRTEARSGKGSLTHTSSEEHSDGAGSTHAEVNGLENEAGPEDSSDMTAAGINTAGDALERESIDSQIDRGQSIDPGCIKGSENNNATEVDDTGTSTQTDVGNTSNTTVSGEDCGDRQTALVEHVSDENCVERQAALTAQPNMSQEEHQGFSQVCQMEENSESEGSSVDAIHNGLSCYEEIDLYIQEESDLPGKISYNDADARDRDSRQFYPDGNSDNVLGVIKSDIDSTNKDPYQSYLANSFNASSDTKISRVDTSYNLIDPLSVKGSGISTISVNNDGILVDDSEKHVTQQNGLGNFQENDSEVTISESEDKDCSESSNSPHENCITGSELDSQHDAPTSGRSKREISVVDLLGSRATAGSAIRAGIIQDMMVDSTRTGQTADSATSSSKVDNSIDADSATGNETREKSSIQMTQQKQAQEEISNVDKLVNGSLDTLMEQREQCQQQQQQHHQQQPEQATETQHEEPSVPLIEAVEAVEASKQQADKVAEETHEQARLHTGETSDAQLRETEGKQAEEQDGTPSEQTIETRDSEQQDTVESVFEKGTEMCGASDKEHRSNTNDANKQEPTRETDETPILQDSTSEHPCGMSEAIVQQSGLEKQCETLDKHQGAITLHDEAMTNLQAHAQAQQAKANLLITSLRARLRKKDLELRNIREGHERQMTAVVAHLLRLEGEMQKEQKQVIEALADRDDIIHRQKAAIDDLTEKNERLMRTLKESQQYHAGNGVSQQNGDISIRDHGNKVVIRGTKGRSSDRSIKSSSGEFKSGNGEKPKVRFTTAMMERLRRHKSSLELYRPEPLEPLIEGSLRYFSSQDNLVDDEGEGEEQTNKADRKGDKKPVRREGNLQKKQRCRSLVDYPFVGGLEEADEEIGGSSESCYENGFSSSPSRISRHDSGLSSSMSSLTGSGETPSWVKRWSGEGGSGGVNGGIRSRVNSSGSLPQSPSSPNCTPSPSNTASFSPSPSSSSPYGFSELAKSRSVPHALPTVSENDAAAVGAGATGKERPHSLTSVELLTRDLSRSNSANSTSTPNLTPAGSATSVASSSPPSNSSESNPFKSFKNVFKRRGSKKKRSVALSQSGNQEHSETVKQYFKKHDLT